MCKYFIYGDTCPSAGLGNLADRNHTIEPFVRRETGFEARVHKRCVAPVSERYVRAVLGLQDEPPVRAEDSIRVGYALICAS